MTTKASKKSVKVGSSYKYYILLIWLFLSFIYLSILYINNLHALSGSKYHQLEEQKQAFQVENMELKNKVASYSSLLYTQAVAPYLGFKKSQVIFFK